MMTTYFSDHMLTIFFAIWAAMLIKSVSHLLLSMSLTHSNVEGQGSVNTSKILRNKKNLQETLQQEL
jgi:hypothetical protein